MATKILTGAVFKDVSKCGRNVLLASTILAANWAVPAMAQNTPVAQEAPRAISIPAGPLTPALNRLAGLTGLQILFDADLTRGKTTSGVTGTLTPAQALDRVLAGTGVTARFTGAGQVALSGVPATSPIVNGAVENSLVLDEITVQGEKVSRDYFRTFTSIGVVTEQDLRDFNITTLTQAFNVLANTRSFVTADGNNSFAVRGLNAEGVTQPSRAAPIISVIIDGAPQNVEAMRRGSRGLWDVEQVEVLRGPQSTLQGRNSLGGSVLIKTKDPTFTPEAIIDGSVGGLSTRSGAFAVSAPLVDDQVAFRISGQISRETKDITYTDPTVKDLREDEFEQIRAKLLIKPHAVPGLKALLSFSRTHDKPGWNAVTGPDFFARRFDPTVGYAAEFRDTYVNRYGADISYEIAPGWTLTSLSTLSDTDLSIKSPAGAILQRGDKRDGRDFSQDLRLSFDPPGSKLSGVVGLFAGRYTTDIDSYLSTSALLPFGIPTATVQDLKANTATTSLAAYADLRYRVLDRWTLLGGGRLVHDRVAGRYTGEALDLAATQYNVGMCMVLGCVPTPVYGRLDERSSVTNPVFLPKIGIAFDITPDQTVAATATRGYRSGFSEAVAGTTTLRTVSPEYLWSYELAYRSKWFDNRLQFNANAFYYDYKNQQILTYNPSFPGQTVTENSGKSHAYGAEIEARWRPIEELTLFSSLGLLKTRFDRAVTAVGDLRGNEFPEAPAVTFAAGATWRHRSGFFIGADASYTDGFYSAGDLTNTPSRHIKSFMLVNAQAGYENEYGTVALFARNLLDKQYLTSIDETGLSATIGDGRLVGVRGTLRF